MKCPKCGSNKVQATNGTKYAAALAAAAAAAIPLMPINKGWARATMISVGTSICPYREFICLNPLCKDMFSVKATY